MDSDLDLGYPPSNGDVWQFNVRDAEVLDAAGFEIVSWPERCPQGESDG